MKIYDARTSFAGGELSPALYGRVDMAQYQIGCRELKNFIVLPQGAVVNRPGTRRLGEDRAYTAVRLAPFVFSSEDSCVLAFGDGFVDRYDRHGFQETILDSPYRKAHLPKLRWLQSADVMYLFHPDVPVHTLSRTPNGWEFNEVTFEKGPFEDVNTDPEKKLIFWAWSGSRHKMDANFDMSEWLHLGLLIRVEFEIKAKSEELSVARGSDTEWGPWATVRYVFGPFTYRTSGKWQGTLEVQRCRPEGWAGKDEEDWEWETFKTYTSGDDAEENFAFSGVVEEYADHYRFRYKGNKDAITVNVSWEGGIVYRLFRVVEILSDTSAYVEDVEGKRGNVAPGTDAWAIGSFGPHYGYPSMGIFHQERLVLANTRHSPQSIWMSQPASWHNFGASIPAKDDDSIMVTLASKEVNEIRGLSSRGDLLIFTAGGEWSAKAGQKTDVFTPSSIVITPSGYRGSMDLEPLDVGDVTLFVQRQGTVIRSLGYSLEVDGYSAPEISVLSAHMFENNPVARWTYQQTPWSVAWCALEDGTVAAVTLQKEHQVTAWTRHEFGNAGKVAVKDLCSIPGEMQDDLFLAVWRETSPQPDPLPEWGLGTIRIELMNHWDAGVGVGTYLDNERYPVRSALETMDIEIGGGGTLQGRHKQTPVVTLRLMKTAGLRAGVVHQDNERAPMLDGLRFPGMLSPGRAAPPFSGDARMEIPGGVARQCRIRVENDEDAPVGLLAIFPEVCVGYEEMRQSG